MSKRLFFAAFMSFLLSGTLLYGQTDTTEANEANETQYDTQNDKTDTTEDLPAESDESEKNSSPETPSDKPDAGATAVSDILTENSEEKPPLYSLTVNEIRYGKHKDKSRIVVDLSGECKGGCSYSLSQNKDNGIFGLSIKGISYKPATPKGYLGDEIKHIIIQSKEDGIEIIGKLTEKGGKIIDPFTLPYKNNLIILDVMSRNSKEVSSQNTKEKDDESDKTKQKDEKKQSAKQTDNATPANTATQKKTKGQIKQWKLKISTDSIKNAVDDKPAIRGIHITGWVAGSDSLRSKIIGNIRGTVLNTVAIALKEMDGGVHIQGVEKAEKYKAYTKAIADPEKMVEDFKKEGLYTIGRIVLFKDDILPVKRPDLAVKTPTGSTWKDKKGKMWADQYSKEVWDYNIDVALRAVKAGFDEIQFDYVRYPTEGKISDCRYSKPGHNWDKGRANLAEFIQYAREKIPDNIRLSIDVFGLTMSSDINEIGQDLPLLALYADYIYPMMYPSHYYPGNYGLKNPNAAPYKVIDRGLSDAMARLELNYAKIRPYLQDFSKYGSHEVGEQIRALRKNYLRSWIMWSPNNKYSWSAYKPEYYKKHIDPDYEP